MQFWQEYHRGFRAPNGENCCARPSVCRYQAALLAATERNLNVTDEEKPQTNSNNSGRKATTNATATSETG